jgi:hypothetical protein
MSSHTRPDPFALSVVEVRAAGLSFGGPSFDYAQDGRDGKDSF